MSLIRQMISSLYNLASSGKAKTCRLRVSSTFSFASGGSIMNGDLSLGPPSSDGRVDLRTKLASRSYFPLLVIWKKVPLMRRTASSSRFSGSFPMRSGPKSKTFSLVMKVLARKLSGSVVGRVFFCWR